MFAGVVALVVALAGCSADTHVELDVPAQADGSFADATQTQLQDAVTHAMAAAGASGAIVGVWAPWSGSWVAGVGTQRMGGGGSVTADMEFRAAQVTRPMTCDVLYALAAEGRVRLGESISTYVSGLADLTDVSLEELCDGTSGIGSYSAQLQPLWTTNPTRVWDARELASYGLGQPRESAPGDAYRDSDAGYVLLGLALERATGRSAADLIADYVADPLDLTATRLPTTAAAEPDAVALKGHVSLPGPDGALNCTEPLDITTLSASTGYTDSGVVSDVHDLHRYVQALATGSLVTGEAAEDRFADAKPAFAGAPSWYLATGGALLVGSMVGQFGAVPGYATAAFSDPTTGLTIVVVLNNSAAGSLAAYLAWELAAISSKAPAASGETAPEAGLPWTAEQYHAAIAAGAVCAPPAP
ncbi:MAG: serine hydrolase domain-containing protein [Microbacterium sp.]